MVHEEKVAMVNTDGASAEEPNRSVFPLTDDASGDDDDGFLGCVATDERESLVGFAETGIIGEKTALTGSLLTAHPPDTIVLMRTGCDVRGLERAENITEALVIRDRTSGARLSDGFLSDGVVLPGFVVHELPDTPKGSLCLGVEEERCLVSLAVEFLYHVDGFLGNRFEAILMVSFTLKKRLHFYGIGVFSCLWYRGF